jgi:hydrogenase expression/formation protein HypC
MQTSLNAICFFEKSADKTNLNKFYLQEEMCLAIPGKLIEIDGQRAIADFSGVKRKIDISLIEEPQIGEYVLVHVGFAIQKVEAEIARETYRLLDDINKEELENELKK